MVGAGRAAAIAAVAVIAVLPVPKGAAAAEAGPLGISRIILNEPRILYERHEPTAVRPDGTGSAGGDESEPAVPPSFPADIEIRRGRLILDDRVSGRRHELFMERARLSGDPATRLDAVLEGALDGVPLSLDSRLGGETAAATPATALPLDLNADLGGIRLALEGWFEDPFSLALTVEARGENLAPLEGLVALPVDPAGGLDLAMTLAGDGERVLSDDLRLTTGESDLAGRIVWRDASPPRLEASLRSDRLALTRPGLEAAPAQAPAAEAGAEAEEAAAGRVFEDTPFEREALNALEAAIDLEIGALALPGFTMENVTARLALEDGRLTLEPLEGRQNGAQQEASLTLDGSGETVRLDAKAALDAFELGDLMAALGLGDLLDLAIALDLGLEGAGVSPAALAGSLDGRVGLAFGEGRVRAGVLEGWLGAAGRALSRLLGGGRDGWLVLTCGRLEAPVEQGIVTLEALALDGRLVTILGGGRIDLGGERLEVDLTPQASVGSIDLSVPLTLRGPLAAPDTIERELLSPDRIAGLVSGLLEGGRRETAGPVRLDADCRPITAAAEPAPDEATAAPEEQERRGVEDTIEDLGRELFRRFQ